MRIDDRIEPLVRDALHSAVKQDIDRLDTSLQAFRDEPSRRAAAELLMAVSAYVALDLYGGRKPNAEQVQTLAEQIARTSEWSGLTADEIATYLHTVLGDQPQPPLDPDAGVMMIFAVTANLLAARPMPEGKWWFNYLDQVEAALETAPDER